MEACASVTFSPFELNVSSQRRGLRPVGILSGGVRAQVIYVHAMLSIIYSVGCDASDLHATPLLYMTNRRGSAEQREPGIRRLQTLRVLEHLAKFQRPQSVNCRDHGKTIIMVHGGHFGAAWELRNLAGT